MADRLTNFTSLYLQNDGNLQNASIKAYHLSSDALNVTASGDVGGWAQVDDALVAGSGSTFMSLSPSQGIWMGDVDIDEASFSVTPDGLLYSAAGEIGGWTITPIGLYAGSGGSYIGIMPGTGIFMGSSILADSPFSVTNTGVLTATSGNVGGWTLTPSVMSGGSGSTYIGLNPGQGIYLGSATLASAPFSVTNAGVLFAESGTIGGWTISSNQLYGGTGNSTVGMEVSGYPFWAGNPVASSAPFFVTSTGFLFASNLSAVGGTVGGWDIYPESITYGTGENIVTFSASGNYPISAGNSNPALAPFSVSQNGSLTAYNAYINGVVVAASGQIGGWNVEPNNLNSGVGAQYMELSPSTGIWMGAVNPVQAPFLVTNTGELYATAGEIAGITITSDGLIFGVGSTSVGFGGTSDYALWAGSATPSLAPFSVTTNGALKADQGVIGGWTITNTGLYSGAGSNYVEMSNSDYAFWAGNPNPYNAPFNVTNTGIVTLTAVQLSNVLPGSSINGVYLQAGTVSANTLNVTNLSAISAAMGNITSGSITGATIQTTMDASGDYVVMDPGGIRGYSTSYGLTFNIPSNGSPPLFASGVIQDAQIINTTLLSSSFQTSSALPWVEITENGVAYREASGKDIYGAGLLYGSGLYGTGVSASLFDPSSPILAIQQERAYADIRFFNRTTPPSGASIVGDMIFLNNNLSVCTTPGTPGTYASITPLNGTTNYLPVYTSSTQLGTSTLYQNGSNLGVGKTNAATALDVNGTTTSTLFQGNFTGPVGINTNSPQGALDVTSTVSAFLPPRMTTTQRNAIIAPVEGSIVYDLTVHDLYVYDGSAWQSVTL